MAPYADKLEAGAFDKRAADARRKLSALSEAARTDIDENDEGLTSRVELLVDHLLTVVGGATPELIPNEAISSLDNAMTALCDALDALEGLSPDDITMAMINKLSVSAEAVSLELFKWPRTEGDDWREAVTQAASTYRRSFGQQVSAVADDVDALNRRLLELQQNIDEMTEEHRTSVTQAVTEMNEQLAAVKASVEALDAQRVSIESQLSRSIERADQAIGAFQQQFSTAQDERSKEFSGRLLQLTENGNENLKKQRAQAEEMLGAIQQQVDEAAELVSVFAAAGTANAFSNEAKEQSELADRWRIAAVLLGVVAAVAAISLFFGHDADDPSWPLVIGKLALGLTFGGLAGYAARQSSHHRRREETARHLELNIAAFGPFVRELDETQQAAARSKVVDAIFLRQVGSNGGTEDGTPASITDDQLNILSRLLDLVRK